MLFIGTAGRLDTDVASVNHPLIFLIVSILSLYVVTRTTLELYKKYRDNIFVDSSKERNQDYE